MPTLQTICQHQYCNPNYITLVKHYCGENFQTFNVFYKLFLNQTFKLHGIHCSQNILTLNYSRFRNLPLIIDNHNGLQ